MSEKLVWQGSPSHVVNTGVYSLCAVATLVVLLIFFFLWQSVVVLCLLLVPAVVIIWKVIELRSRKYSVTTERVRLVTGIITKVTDEIEHYRIKDIKMVEPFLQRLSKCGTMIIETSDRSDPIFELTAVPKPHWLFDELRKHVEECRKKNRVRELDVE